MSSLGRSHTARARCAALWATPMVAMALGGITMAARPASAQVAHFSAGSLAYAQGTLTVDPQVNNIQSQYYQQYDQSLLSQGGVQTALASEPSTNEPPPIIAVVDSGANPSYSLGSRLLPQVNFYATSGGNNDDLYHGTYVAQVAAGGATSSSYAPGVCPTCEVLPIRVGGLAAGGTGQYFTTSAIAGGIYYAASQPGVKVINLSLGGGDDPSGTFNAAPIGAPPVPISSGSAGMMQYAINYAISNGITVVTAAGNWGSDVPTEPSAEVGAVHVASVDQTSILSMWTDHNGPASSPWVDVAAPGCYYVEYTPSGATSPEPASFCGTSSSAPYVSGEAALLYEADPTITPAQVVSYIENTATNPVKKTLWWVNNPGISPDPAYWYAGSPTSNISNLQYNLQVLTANATSTTFSYTSNDPSDPSGTDTITKNFPGPIGKDGLQLYTQNLTYSTGGQLSTEPGGVTYGTVNAGLAVQQVESLGQSTPPPAPTTSPTAPTTSPTAPTTSPTAPTTSPAAPTTSPAAPTTSPAAPSAPPIATPPPGGFSPFVGGGGGTGSPALPTVPSTTPQVPGSTMPTTPAPSVPTTTAPVHVPTGSGPFAPPPGVVQSAKAAGEGNVATASPTGAGWWTASKSGVVVAHGPVQNYGGLGKVKLHAAIVGMASTPDGKGYWLLGKDGGIFSFGDAKFYGSTGGEHLNAAIVSISASPKGNGYWLLAKDGGVFTFGSARFYGSTGALKPAPHVVAMSATTDGKGYWLVSSTGKVYAFGDAVLYKQSTRTSAGKASRVVGIVPTQDGKGYWVLLANGAQVGYGDAR